ncbi:MAG: metallophosphoesterase family protein [Gemmatimonadaceae bacterium]
MSDVIRILLLADTHLGFDLPVRPRIERRRRGHDFLANYATALQPALDGAVDLVVHGGDVFNRSHVVPSLAYQAFAPLIRVADAGVPVYVVPGNHERGRLPHLRFAQHQRIHIFDRPRTFVADVRGVRVALAGFPSERDEVRTKFNSLMQETAWHDAPADVRLLCLHQCVEGATVGPANYTFTTAADVIRGADIPFGFAVVLAGHIHRHQTLVRDLRGRALAAPVLYPGSIERTSFAEADEEKGYMVVEVACGDGARVEWDFRKLPARPLVRHTLSLNTLAEADLEGRLRALIDEAPADAVLTIRIEGAITERAARLLSAAQLRSLAPATMNVAVRPLEATRIAGSRATAVDRASSSG